MTTWLGEFGGRDRLARAEYVALVSHAWRHEPGHTVMSATAYLWSGVFAAAPAIASWLGSSPAPVLFFGPPLFEFAVIMVLNLSIAGYHVYKQCFLLIFVSDTTRASFLRSIHRCPSCAYNVSSVGESCDVAHSCSECGVQINHEEGP